MSNKIYIKMLSEDALSYIQKNINKVYNYIVENEDNSWILELDIPNFFVTKKYEIDDFQLIDNPEEKDRDIALKNSIALYESIKTLPRFILTDEKFWLWLYLDKFYAEVKSMMKIQSVSTIKDHWMFNQGIRRGLFFGVLSRCYFRVELTVDNNREDKYELTKWIIENPERFRNLTWRSFSSETHLVRGIISAEKKAIETIGSEETSIYPEVAKYVSSIGSVRLLDVISEKDIEDMVYNWMVNK